MHWENSGPNHVVSERVAPLPSDATPSNTLTMNMEWNDLDWSDASTVTPPFGASDDSVGSEQHMSWPRLACDVLDLDMGWLESDLDQDLSLGLDFDLPAKQQQQEHKWLEMELGEDKREVHPEAPLSVVLPSLVESSLQKHPVATESFRVPKRHRENDSKHARQDIVTKRSTGSRSSSSTWDCACKIVTGFCRTTSCAKRTQGVEACLWQLDESGLRSRLVCADLPTRVQSTDGALTICLNCLDPDMRWQPNAITTRGARFSLQVSVDETLCSVAPEPTAVKMTDSRGADLRGHLNWRNDQRTSLVYLHGFSFLKSKHKRPRTVPAQRVQPLVSTQRVHVQSWSFQIHNKSNGLSR